MDAALWLLTVRVGLRRESDAAWQLFYFDGTHADGAGARVVGEAFNGSLGRHMQVVALPAAEGFTEATSGFSAADRGASAALLRRDVFVSATSAHGRGGSGAGGLWVRSREAGPRLRVGTATAAELVELPAELVYAVPADPEQEALVMLQLLVPVRKLVHLPLVPPAVVEQLMRFGFDGPHDAQFLPLVFPLGQLKETENLGVPLVPALRWMMQATGQGPQEESGLPEQAPQLLAASVLVDALVARPDLIDDLVARVAVGSATTVGKAAEDHASLVVDRAGDLAALVRAETWRDVVPLAGQADTPVLSELPGETSANDSTQQPECVKTVSEGRVCGGDPFVVGPMLLAHAQSPRVLADRAACLTFDQRRRLMVLLGSVPELGRWFAGTSLDPARMTLRDVAAATAASSSSRTRWWRLGRR